MRTRIGRSFGISIINLPEQGIQGFREPRGSDSYEDLSGAGIGCEMFGSQSPRRAIPQLFRQLLCRGVIFPFCHLELISSALSQWQPELWGAGTSCEICLVTIDDVWNCIKNPIGSGNVVPYDEECDRISAKLKKAYFEAFLGNVFPA